MILTVDSGNSRVKWGAHADGAWLTQEAALPDEVSALGARWRALGPLRAVYVSNVAGAAMRAALAQQLSQLPVAAHWVMPRAQAYGVRNHYRNPEQLGVDRWMALVGARRLHAGACAVVLAGTALTADALSAAGDFLGGLIAPGLQTMIDALAVTTAGVKITSGDYETFPTQTRHAVATGAIAAALGCIAHVRGELALLGDQARRAPTTSPVAVLLSGGAAPVLAPHIGEPLRVIDNLVLEGLLTLAEHESATAQRVRKA